VRRPRPILTCERAFRFRGPHAANSHPPGCAGRTGTSLKRTAGCAGVRRSVAQAFAGAFAFFSALRAFCAMNRAVFACASLSTIWTGGDFIR
jgi:hypothetical protein